MRRDTKGRSGVCCAGGIVGRAFPIFPLADESATSFVHRCAKRCHLTLHDYCQTVLRLDHQELFGDLDVVLAGTAADRVSEASKVHVDVIRRLVPPKEWRRSTREKGKRAHSAPVSICPDCLETPVGCAGRSWRSAFAIVCPIHRRFLLNRCPRCGTPIRHRDDGFNLHWLDRGTVCIGCRQKFPSGVPAPEPFLRAAERWNLAMEGSVADGMDPEDICRLSHRLVNTPWNQREIAAAFPLCECSPSPSLAMAALVLNAWVDGRCFQSGDFGQTMFSLLCGLPIESHRLIAGLRNEVPPVGQLSLNLS